jgi:hypothetical protein
MEIWQVIAIVLSALVVGVYWGPWIAVTRTIATSVPKWSSRSSSA